MEKLFDISGIIGLIFLALTLFWAGLYNIKLKQTNRGLLFILFGILVIVILAKGFLYPDNSGL
ncbi:hypothetical protein SDC9_172117 [bioreactor metagenome]|uniref:Uncharacterized protein n=1 Tax=bioreactor metagenome TaxID=1076179 RepID=A0A645GDG0_9ZZZZ